MNRILLLPICGLGDAICYLPSIKAVRLKYPKAKIVVIVATHQAREILEGASLDVEVEVFNRSIEGTILAPFKLLLELRKQHFDVVMSRAPKNSVRVPLLAFLSGAKKRVGATSENLKFLYNCRVDVSDNAHAFERYHQLFTGAGLEISTFLCLPCLHPPEGSKESANKLWTRAGLDCVSRVVGFASGADTNIRGKWDPSLKRWGIHHYANVADWLFKAFHAQVVMFGVKQEALLAEKIADCGGVNVINFCGKTSIGELQWLIQKCQALVTNDTGTMHLAAALQTPVVTLFGPTDPADFGPLGVGNKVIQGHSRCSPCFPKPTCGLDSCLAMDAITPSQVIDCLAELLG